MVTDHSFCGRLRRLLGLPSLLEKTKFLILQDEQGYGERIGFWRCNCGHKNTILHLAEPCLHPLGLLQCRACPLNWCPPIPAVFTTQRLNITSHKPMSNAANTVRAVPELQTLASTHIYVCLGYGCGLSWRTDIKAEWLSGHKRRVLLLGGKRGKLHCDCGMKIFEPGNYHVFEVGPLMANFASAFSRMAMGGGSGGEGSNSAGETQPNGIADNTGSGLDAQSGQQARGGGLID